MIAISSLKFLLQKISKCRNRLQRVQVISSKRLTRNTRLMEINLDKLKQIREAKQEEYGDFKTNLNLIGQSWSALLGLKNPIPGWMVSLMYVQSKIIRVRKKFKEDSYSDAQNYLYQAKLMQEDQQKK